MPEQNEWNDAAEARSDSGDYTWHPTYARRVADSMNPRYDVRTLADKVRDLEAEVKRLDALLARQAGTL